LCRAEPVRGVDGGLDRGESGEVRAVVVAARAAQLEVGEVLVRLPVAVGGDQAAGSADAIARGGDRRVLDDLNAEADVAVDERGVARRGPVDRATVGVEDQRRAGPRRADE